jgi:hypothetical protein
LSDGVIMAMVGKKNGVAGDLKTKWQISKERLPSSTSIAYLCKNYCALKI